MTHRQFSTETDKSTQTSKSIVYSTNILGSCSGLKSFYYLKRFRIYFFKKKTENEKGCGAALQSDHPLEPGYISTKSQPIVES